MSDEKNNIILTVEVIDNLADAKKRLDNARASYEHTGKAIVEITKQLKALKKEGKENTDRTKDLQAAKKELCEQFKKEEQTCKDLEQTYKKAQKVQKENIKQNEEFDSGLEKVRSTIEETINSKKKFSAFSDSASIRQEIESRRDLLSVYDDSIEKRKALDQAGNPTFAEAEINNIENAARAHEHNANAMQEALESQAVLAQATDQASSSNKFLEESIQSIINNYLKAAESVSYWETKLKDALASGTATNEEIQEITTSLNGAKEELANCSEKMNIAAKNNNLFDQAMRSSRDAVREMQAELERLEKVPLQFLTAEQKDAVKKRIEELKADLQSLGDSLVKLDNIQLFGKVLEQFQVVSAGFTVISNSLKAFGVESEVIDKLVEKAKALDDAMKALGVISEFIKKQKYETIAATWAEIAARIKNTLATQAEAAAARKAAAAQTIHTGITSGSTVAKLAAAAATWVLNAALGVLLLPITLIIIAITALIALFVIFTNKSNDLATAQENAAKAEAEYEKQAKKTADTLEEIDRNQKKAIDDRKNKMREEILELQKNGATAEEIAAARAKAEQDLRDEEIRCSEEREKALQEENEAAKKNIEEQQKLLAELAKKKGESSKAYKEQKEKLDEILRTQQKIVDSVDKENQKRKELNLESAEAAQKTNDEATKKYQEKALQELEWQKKRQEEQNKFLEATRKRQLEIEEKSIKDSFEAKQEWEAKKFKDQQEWDAKKYKENEKYELRKLDMLKKFGKIESDEYNAQYQILKTQSETFYKNQENALQSYQEKQLQAAKEYNAQQRKELLELLGQDTEIKIEEINKKYEEAAKKIEAFKPDQGKLSDEEYLNSEAYKDYEIQKAKFETALEKQKQAELAELQKTALTNRLEDIDKKYQQAYDDELEKFIGTEKEKSELELKMHKQRMDERKKNLDQMLADGIISQEQYNQTIREDEARLEALRMQDIQNRMDATLLAETGNANTIFKKKMEFLDAELEANKENHEIYNKLLAEKEQAEKEHHDSRISRLDAWTAKTKENLTNVDSKIKEFEDGQLQVYENNNNKKKEELKARLDKGLIDQKTYDEEVAKSDKELEAKKKEIARRQAIRQKAMKIFDITMGTASAIINALETQPFFPMGLAMAASAGAMGAQQLAVAVSTPLPKASRGLLLNGPSHAQGGIPIEAEGGEAIINKRSTAMFRPLLSAINEAGGGVKFAKGGVVGNYLPNMNAIFQDGGYAARSYQSQSEGITRNDMQQIMDNIKIYTTVEDYRRADANYSEIVSTGSV